MPAEDAYFRVNTDHDDQGAESDFSAPDGFARLSARDLAMQSNRPIRYSAADYDADQDAIGVDGFSVGARVLSDADLVARTIVDGAPPAMRDLDASGVVDDQAQSDSIQEPISGFLAGTMITTMRGPIPVEDLRVGDNVFTRDNGFQKVRWVATRTAPEKAKFAPVKFEDDAIGNDGALVVSPVCRVLLQGWKAELLTGESEVLVAAKFLINGTTIHRYDAKPSTFVSFMFDNHEVVLANGCLAESFHPDHVGLHCLDPQMRDGLMATFPHLVVSDTSGYGSHARRVLKAHEAALLLADD